MAGRSARALVVELVADVGDFVKGTQKADDALADFVNGSERDLDDLSAAGKDAARDLERAFDGVSLDKVARDVDQATDKMERSFDNLQKEAKKSFDKIEHHADDAADGMGRETFGEAGAEAGQEFATNLGTAVASGDMTTIGTDSASALVGAFAGFPGFGVMFAPIALAATLVFANIQKKAEQAARQVALAFERTTATAFETLDASLRGSSFIQLLEDVGGGEAVKGVQKITQAFEGTGLTLQDIQQAYVNGGKELDDILATGRKIQSQSTVTKSLVRGTVTELDAQGKKQKNVLDLIDRSNKSLQTGVEVGGELNSVITSKQAASAVSSRSASFREQAKEMNSMAAAQDRINGGFTDPRINRAIQERTKLLAAQEVQARKVASAVRGAPGTVVGGRRLD